MWTVPLTVRGHLASLAIGTVSKDIGPRHDEVVQAMGTARPVTMRDVARVAGVGVGTVSRVLSNVGSVAPATRERVEAVARELSFRPSALGRDLKRRATDTIGLLVADISNTFYGEFAQGVLAAAKDRGYHVILAASGEDAEAERENLDVLLAQRVEGIIAFPTGGNIEHWSAARDLGIRVVVADREIASLDLPSIAVDHLDGARRLTEHLIALGHRRIGYLGGPAHVSSGRLREEGYRRAHADAGIEVDEALVVRARFTRDNASASARRLLAVTPGPTAVFASNNVLAEAALDALRERGLVVPHNLSVVMFDDVPWARLVEPPMTVVAQPTFEMGRAAVEMVLDPASGGPASRTLPTRLIVRGSARPWREGREAGPTSSDPDGPVLASDESE